MADAPLPPSPPPLRLSGLSDVVLSTPLGQFVVRTGVTAAIAGYLVYVLGAQVLGNVKETHDLVVAHVQVTTELAANTRMLVNEMTQLCVIAAADNKAQQRACFAALATPPVPTH